MESCSLHSLRTDGPERGPQPGADSGPAKCDGGGEWSKEGSPNPYPSAPTALCEAEGGTSCVTCLLTAGHICRADPKVQLCFGDVGHRVKGVVGRQEGGLAGKTFCSFMCFVSFSVIDLVGPLTSAVCVGSAAADLSS